MNTCWNKWRNWPGIEGAFKEIGNSQERKMAPISGRQLALVILIILMVGNKPVKSRNASAENVVV